MSAEMTSQRMSTGTREKGPHLKMQLFRIDIQGGAEFKTEYCINIAAFDTTA